MRISVLTNSCVGFLKTCFAFSLFLFVGAGYRKKDNENPLDAGKNSGGCDKKELVVQDVNDSSLGGKPDYVAVPTYDANGNEIWECSFNISKPVNMNRHYIYNSKGQIERAIYSDESDGSVDYFVTLKT